MTMAPEGSRMTPEIYDLVEGIVRAYVPPDNTIIYVLGVSPVQRLRVWSGPYTSIEEAMSSTLMRDRLAEAFITVRWSPDDLSNPQRGSNG